MFLAPPEDVFGTPYEEASHVTHRAQKLHLYGLVSHME